MVRYDYRLDPLAAHVNVKLLTDEKSGIDQSETDWPLPGLVSHAALKPLSRCFPVGGDGAAGDPSDLFVVDKDLVPVPRDPFSNEGDGLNDLFQPAYPLEIAFQDLLKIVKLFLKGLPADEFSLVRMETDGKTGKG